MIEPDRYRNDNNNTSLLDALSLNLKRIYDSLRSMNLNFLITASLSLLQSPPNWDDLFTSISPGSNMSHQWLPDEILNHLYVIKQSREVPGCRVAGPENSSSDEKWKDGGFPEGCLQVKWNGCKVWSILRRQFTVSLSHWDENSTGT